MKKLFLITTMFFITTCLCAQETPKYIYAQILGTEKFLSKKVTVTIDYGQASSIFEDTRLRDENGNAKVFNSMVDAMNYMGALGWEFQQAYVVTVGTQNVYHWLLRKTFNSVDTNIQEEMKKHFPTKKDLK